MDRRPDARPEVAAARPGRRAAPRAAGARRWPPCRRPARRPGARAACARRRRRWSTSRSAPDPAEEARDRLERPLRGGQPDPLDGRRGGIGGVGGRGVGAVRAWAVDAVARPGSQRLEPLEAEREVRAALGAGDRVDLVDDDVLDVAEDLARGAGEHQVERLGRRDQDVGRVAGDLAPILGGRVARPAGDRDVRRLVAQPRRRQGDPGERRPEVALDVVGQGLERRDVQDADRAGGLAGRCGPGVGRQPVQAPQERREGLATPRRGVDQRVAAARDGGPAAGLRVGRRLEAGPEPVTDGGREERERIGDDGRRSHGRRVYRAAAISTRCSVPRDPDGPGRGPNGPSGGPHGRIEDTPLSASMRLTRSIEKDAWCGQRIGKGRHTK